jgi:hypothetical protein
LGGVADRPWGPVPLALTAATIKLPLREAVHDEH